jgi:GAF domain
LTSACRSGGSCRRPQPIRSLEHTIRALRSRPPIKREGRLWGAMIVSTRDALLPTDTAERLQRLTDLIATALANDEARGSGAARRGASGAAPTGSTCRVATVPERGLHSRHSGGRTAPRCRPCGVARLSRRRHGDDDRRLDRRRRPHSSDRVTVSTGWRQRRRPHLRDRRSRANRRIDGDADAEGEAADLTRSLRVRSTVRAPILVEGKLWGALMAATRGVEPWAENAETRIAAFTELVATAIANAESREGLPSSPTRRRRYGVWRRWSRVERNPTRSAWP